MRDRRPSQRARSVLLIGIVVLAATAAVGDPCTTPKGACGGAQVHNYVGCEEHDGRRALGAKATLDPYDPTLCGDANLIAGSFWWVMLNQVNIRWVQAGWSKFYTEGLTHPGTLANYCEYRCLDAVPPEPVWRQKIGEPVSPGEAQAELCSCDLSAEGPEGTVYRMIAGGVTLDSPRYEGGHCFYWATLKGETWHPNNQMAGDRNDKVAFQECQTRWRDGAGEQWRKAGLTEVPGQGDSTDYGLGITTETVGGQERTVVRVWDKHCPEP